MPVPGLTEDSQCQKLSTFGSQDPVQSFKPPLVSGCVCCAGLCTRGAKLHSKALFIEAQAQGQVSKYAKALWGLPPPASAFPTAGRLSYWKSYFWKGFWQNWEDRTCGSPVTGRCHLDFREDHQCVLPIPEPTVWIHPRIFPFDRAEPLIRSQVGSARSWKFL